HSGLHVVSSATSSSSEQPLSTAQAGALHHLLCENQGKKRGKKDIGDRKESVKGKVCQHKRKCHQEKCHKLSAQCCFVEKPLCRRGELSGESEALNWGWMQWPVEEDSSLDGAESLEKVRSGTNGLLSSFLILGSELEHSSSKAPKLTGQSFRTVLQHLIFF
ncbi:hypothetical protein EK904_008799, partial [Melospiza melodia maxima]